MEETRAAGRLMLHAAVAALLLAWHPPLAAAAVPSARMRDEGAALRHDVHVTQSRVVVENGVIVWRVRCFADDLEKGLRGFAKAPAFALATDKSADSLVTAYFNARVHVDANGRRLRARLLQSSRESDPVGGAVHVYVLQLDAGTQPASLTVRNALLFEQFPTEQNLVVVLAMPGDRRRSLYFSAADDVAQTVSLR